MKKGPFLLLLPIFLLSILTAYSYAQFVAVPPDQVLPESSVFYVGSQLYVKDIQGNIQPFEIRGMTWNSDPWRTFLGIGGNICYINDPAKSCTTPKTVCTPSTCTCTNLTTFEFHSQIVKGYGYDRDFPVMKNMLGINTIHTYAPLDSGVAKKLKQYGLRAFDNAYWIPDEDFTDTNVAQRIKQEFIQYADHLKNLPGFNDFMLMLSFGKENDVRFCTGNWRNNKPPCTQTELTNQAKAFYKLANDSISAVKLKYPDFVPMTIVNGGFYFGVPKYFTQQGIADDSIMTSLDAWSVNVYWGTTFGDDNTPYKNLFSQYHKTGTKKPFVLSGFSYDEYKSVLNAQKNKVIGGAPDPIFQAQAIKSLMGELDTEVKRPGSLVSGGILELYADSYYQPGYGEEWTCGVTTHDREPGFLSDGMHDEWWNEEWDGVIVSRIPDLNLTFKDAVQIKPAGIEVCKIWGIC